MAKTNYIQALNLVFNKPPEEIINTLHSHGIEVSENWEEQLEIIKRRCFTVAKVSSADILQTIKNNVDKAVEKGVPFSQFKKSLQIQLTQAGFAQREDGKAWRLNTIYRTNIQSAYMEGRYNEQISATKEFPYWTLIAVVDKRTTDDCRTLHGVTLRYDDPFWSVNYPPRHYLCRSRVVSASKKDIRSGKAQLSSSSQYRNTMSAKGFATNPGEWSPDISRYSRGIGESLTKVLKEAEENANVEELTQLLDCDLADAIKAEFSSLSEAIEYSKKKNKQKNCLKKIPGQNNWETYKLIDCKDIPNELKAVAPELLEKQKDLETAKELIMKRLEITTHGKIFTKSPLQDIKWESGNAFHIAEKRKEARERYTDFFVSTLEKPDEIWFTKYEREIDRITYIKYFRTEDGTQLQAVTNYNEGIDNYIITVIPKGYESINNNRVGELMYVKKHLIKSPDVINKLSKNIIIE